MAYSELIKNFEKIRAYMREFYVYGFKSRSDYDTKSARSYDDERRRLESWLGDYMRFTKSAEGKNVFLSVDNRAIEHNPLFKAWKAKSFTDGDITLHFILFDILHSPEVKLTLKEIIERIDEAYLSSFSEPMSFDESTVRKKLKEYAEEGLVRAEKQGRQIVYSRVEDVELTDGQDALDFFSETAPCGVVGSYLLDKIGKEKGMFSFKHHYTTQTVDSAVLEQLFDAMHQKRYISVSNLSIRFGTPRELQLVPIKILASVQSGRQYLIAFHERANRINTYRVDYISNVKPGEVYPKYDTLRKEFAKLEGCMWGVNCKWSKNHLEHVEFTVRINPEEQYIVQRLEREKRCGSVEQLDKAHYRFSADVFDSMELVPWVRTFIMRITEIHFSNPRVARHYQESFDEMCRIYDIGGEDNAVQ